jgi:hypothetical protein
MNIFIRVEEPIDAARWIGRDPCVSFIRSGWWDFESKSLEDYLSAYEMRFKGLEGSSRGIREFDFYLRRSVYC